MEVTGETPTWSIVLADGADAAKVKTYLYL